MKKIDKMKFQTLGTDRQIEKLREINDVLIDEFNELSKEILQLRKKKNVL